MTDTKALIAEARNPRNRWRKDVGELWEEPVKMEHVQPVQPQVSPPPSAVAMPAAELNDIRVEFFGGKVRINALMDKEGLEDLEKKIAAFKMILS